MMSPICFRRFISGSLPLAFVIHTCRAHGATFPTTLTTTALDRSSSGWFTAPACTATAEGHQPPGPAPPSLVQHRIQRLDLLHPASFNVRVRTFSRKARVGNPADAAVPAAAGAYARSRAAAATARWGLSSGPAARWASMTVDARPTRATAKCACTSPRIRPRASRSATAAAKEGSRRSRSQCRTVEGIEMRTSGDKRDAREGGVEPCFRCRAGLQGKRGRVAAFVRRHARSPGGVRGRIAREAAPGRRATLRLHQKRGVRDGDECPRRPGHGAAGKRPGFGVDGNIGTGRKAVHTGSSLGLRARHRLLQSATWGDLPMTSGGWRVKIRMWRSHRTSLPRARRCCWSAQRSSRRWADRSGR